MRFLSWATVAFLAAHPRSYCRSGPAVQSLQTFVYLWRETHGYRDRMALLGGLGILLLKHLYEVRGLSVETLDRHPKASLDKEIHRATAPFS
jgi:hypothetical protein